MSLEATDAVPGRAVARLARSVEVALATVELSMPQYRILIFLSEGGEEAASALARRLAVSRPSVTALVDGLVQRGLVERRSDPADRRRVRHHLTETGHSALARADEAVCERLSSLAEHLGARRSARAVEGLRQWSEALDASRKAVLSSS